jgi:hypothetical protein
MTITRAVEWDCEVSPEAREFAEKIEADLTEVWVQKYAPWLAKLSWPERLMEWLTKRVKITWPKRGEE